MVKEPGIYTREEILNQAQAWEKTLKYWIGRQKDLLKVYPPVEPQEVIFTGCGSSHYLSITAAANFRYFSGKNVRAVPSSEIIYFPELIFEGKNNFLLVAISRSGETSEVCRAVEEVSGKYPIYTVAVSSYAGSLLTRQCNSSLIPVGAEEQSVVMTKSFTTILLLIQMWIAVRMGNSRFLEQLQSLPTWGGRTLQDFQEKIKNFVQSHNFGQFVFLGGGPYYGLACESMLKMQEMALVPSEAYYPLEFRHGPISAVGSNTLVTYLDSGKVIPAEEKLLKEVKDLGAKVIWIGEKIDESKKKVTDLIFELSSGLEIFPRTILYLPITQLLAYYVSLSHGQDPDRPRYLSSVVKLDEV